MNGGPIEGGWEFIYAAYGFIYFVLAAYAVSLVVRDREQKEEQVALDHVSQR